MDTLWLFTLLAFGIMIVPGLDMAFVLGSALAHGRRTGLTAVAGMVAGGAAHVVLGTLGIGLLLQVAPGAFNALLAAGAAYVAWIGVSLWRSPATLGTPRHLARPSAWGTFCRAMATCLLNPKAYLFMVAVFPQFMRPQEGQVVLQAVVLGAIIAVAQAMVYAGVALGATRLSRRLEGHAGAQAMLSRGVALLLVATSAWTVVQTWRA